MMNSALIRRYMPLLIRGVTIHWCIAMHRYFVTTICINTADPINVARFTWNYMHRYSWKGLIRRDTSFWSDCWKYPDITQQSHVMIQPAAVVVVSTPSTGVAGFARCSWSQVSLLSCFSWCPSGMLLCLDTYRDMYCIVTSVSRYIS